MLALNGFRRIPESRALTRPCSPALKLPFLIVNLHPSLRPTCLLPTTARLSHPLSKRVMTLSQIRLTCVTVSSNPRQTRLYKKQTALHSKRSHAITSTGLLPRYAPARKV